jgi:hypothetical protein
MARKTVTFTVTTEGRDKGKQFVITEMPASKAERWGMRALNTLSKVVGTVPPNLANAGMQGLVLVGLSAFARAEWDDIEPLMDEMFTCIQIKEPAITRPLTEDDIEEISTRALLRQEVLDLHLGFFKAAVSWILTAAQMSLKPQAEASQNTETSLQA